MPQNQYLPIGTGVGANTLTAAQWAALGTLLAQGFQSGVVPSIQFNTFLRQLSVPVSGLAQLTADNQSADVLDDGVPANFEAKLKTALQNISAYVTQAGQAVFFAAGGTSTAYTGTLAPAPTSLTPDMEVLGAFATANTSTSPTLNLNGLGAKPILKQGGGAPAAGDIAGFIPFVLNSAGSAWVINGLVASDIAAQAAASGISSFSTGFKYFGTAGAQTFTATYTGKHKFTGVAGSGGGGYNSQGGVSAAGGGGGGGCGIDYLNLTIGQVVPLVVGAAGTAGLVSGPTLATAGGTTSVNGIAWSSGGSPGNSNATASGAGTGGAAGTGLLSTPTGINIAGAPGSQGFNSTVAIGGAGGQAAGGLGGFGGQLTSQTGNPVMRQAAAAAVQERVRQPVEPVQPVLSLFSGERHDPKSLRSKRPHQGHRAGHADLSRRHDRRCAGRRPTRMDVGWDDRGGACRACRRLWSPDGTGRHSCACSRQGHESDRARSRLCGGFVGCS